jgi:hypothetical protein
MNNFKPTEILSGIFTTTLLLILFLWSSSKMGDVGNLLTGVGTLGLLFAAIWQIPQELEKNRNQRHKERVTDIAFDVGEVSIHFIDSIKGLISPLSFKHEILEEDKTIIKGKNSHFTDIYKVYRYRQHLYDKKIEKFYEISWKVRYLKNSKDLEIKVEQLKQILWNLSIKISFLKDFEDEEPDLAKQYYNEFLKVTSNDELITLEKDILDLLAKNFD